MPNIKYINGNPITASAVDLANGSLSGSVLTDGAVTTTKLADGAVTLAKLGSDVELEPPDGSITTAKVADGAVTTAKLAQGAVTTPKLADGSVTDAKLSTASGQALSRISGLQDEKIPWPTATSKHGLANQVLRTNGDGTTRWEYEQLPPEEVMDESVRAWLDDHPEATTTVQDGSITKEKLHPSTLVPIPDNDIDAITESQEISLAEKYLDESGLSHFWGNVSSELQDVKVGLMTNFVVSDAEVTSVDVPSIPTGHTTQGATFDGEYIYRTHHQSNATQLYLMKSTLDGTMVYDTALLNGDDSPMQGHANFMYYWNGNIHVSNTGVGVNVYDAESAEFVEAYTLPVQDMASAIGLQMVQTKAPDSSTSIRCLVANYGGAANISIFTELVSGVFTHFATFHGGYSWYNRQSVTADSTFVYVPLHGYTEYGSDVASMIDIYTLLGQHVCTINLPIYIRKEIEDLAVYGYTLYCFFADGTVYAIDATKYLKNRAPVERGAISFTSSDVSRVMLCTNQNYDIGTSVNGITTYLPLVPTGNTSYYGPIDVDIFINLNTKVMMNVIGARDSNRVRLIMPIRLANGTMYTLFLNYGVVGVPSKMQGLRLENISIQDVDGVSVAQARNSAGVTSSDIDSFIQTLDDKWQSSYTIYVTRVNLSLNSTHRYNIQMTS